MLSLPDLNISVQCCPGNVERFTNLRNGMLFIVIQGLRNGDFF